MKMHNAHQNIKFSQNLLPASITATGAGAILDMQGFEWAQFVINIGTFATFAPTTAEWDITIDVGDDSGLSDAAAPPDADTLGVATSGVVHVCDAATDDEVLVFCPYIGKKRYARITITEVGTVTCIAGIIALQGRGPMPVTNANPA
jgi:hypothetical protein